MKRWLFLYVNLALIGCSAEPVQTATTPVLCILNYGTLLPEEEISVKSLQHRVEAGPLYTVPATIEGVKACDVRYESGVIALEYHFRKGGWLRVKQDARIEYMDQEARLVLPQAENLENILSRAELSAYGATGCGIDWRNPETRISDDDHGVTEEVFHGDVCNCQARIRRDAGKRTIGLLLRSAC